MNIRRRGIRRGWGAAALLLAGACSQVPAEKAAPARARASEPPASAQAKRYAIEGTVRSLDRENREAMVAHKDVPGLMPAMTMPLRVRDEAMYNLLGPGDELSATLVMDGDSSWLEDVVIQKKAGAEADASAPPPALGPRRGDAPPDVDLVNQDGKPLPLRQLRGKAVALTFIFTRCPLPEFCPRMGQNFAAIEKALAGDGPLRARTHLVSVSFDTAYDTPEVLRKYGRGFQAGADAFRHWELATGTPKDVAALAGFFGLEYEEESGQFTHNLRTAVIAPDGTVFRVYRGNDWTPDEIVADLKAALDGSG